jgi:signal transduction histidine kinase/Tfp pilus assembly protein PilF
MREHICTCRHSFFFLPLLACLVAACGMDRSANRSYESDSLRVITAESRRIVRFLNERPDEALALAYGLLVRARQLRDAAAEQIALNTLARALFENGRIDSSRSISIELLHRARQQGEGGQLLHALHTRSWTMSEDGAYDSARILLDEALSLADPEQDSSYIADVLLTRGNVYSAIGAARHAIRDLYAAAAIYERLADSLAQATAYANIGNEYGRAGDLDASCTQLRRAIAINEALGLRHALASDYANLGTSLTDLGRFDEAQAIVHASLAIAVEKNDSLLVAQNLHNLGDIAFRTGRMESARIHLTRSLDIARALGNDVGVMLGTIALAKYHIRYGNGRSAIPQLQTVLATAEELGLREHVSIIHRTLGDAHVATGDTRLAAKHYAQAIAVRDSVHARMTRDALSGVTAELQLRGASNEIERLRTGRVVDELTIERQQLIITITVLVIVLVVGGFILTARIRRAREAQRRLLEQQQAERQKLEHLEELERSFEAQTQALHSRDVFMQTISHELRTPLTSIMGMTDVLRMQRELMTDKMHRYVDVIAESGQKLLQLIDNLIDVAGADRSDFHINTLEMRLEDVATSSVHDVRHFAREKRQQLLFTMHPPVITIMGDPARLRQAITHLLSNAVKFTSPNGTVELAITQESGNVRIDVRDNGIGIAPEHHVRIFQPFVQVDTSLGRIAGGAGVGLPLVKRIVELHGGEIRLESALGRGTTVSILLPLNTSPSALTH